MQYDRVLARVFVDFQPELGAFSQQPFRRIQPREVVQHPRDTGFCRIGAMCTRQIFGHPRHPNAVRVPMFLPEMFANAFGELRKTHYP